MIYKKKSKLKKRHSSKKRFKTSSKHKKKANPRFQKGKMLKSKIKNIIPHSEKPEKQTRKNITMKRMITETWFPM